MTLSRQEILDYAGRYVTPDAVTEFPFNGDLFCLLGRELPEGKVLTDEEGWVFQGYGICSGYVIDDEAKPLGKWVWMHFVSLATFPPAPQVLKLQPPHIVKGRFQDAGRTREFRILKVGIDGGSGKQESGPAEQRQAAPKRRTKAQKDDAAGKIVKFRKKPTVQPAGA